MVVDATTSTTGEPTVTGESIVTEWILPGGVVVTHTATPEGGLATFDVSVENAGSAAVDVRTRLRFDCQVADEDDSDDPTAIGRLAVTPGHGPTVLLSRTRGRVGRRTPTRAGERTIYT